jgi:hypothetical protein
MINLDWKDTAPCGRAGRLQQRCQATGETLNVKHPPDRGKDADHELMPQSPARAAG